MADMQVAAAAYQTAQQLGASPKVLLALFEAGLVESGMRNLPYGDRDSVGFLQQRPSQGWPDPMNVATATKSFVNKATTEERMHPNASAGSIAQYVQVSAYPSRYDAEETQALALLAQVSNGSASTLQTDYTSSGANVDPFTGISDVTKSLSDPHTWVRVGCIIGGSILIYLGIVVMWRQSSVSKELTETAVKVGKVFIK